MPIVKWWGETAKSAGLSQEQYDSGVKAFVDNAVANLPNPELEKQKLGDNGSCLLYTSPSPRDLSTSRMPSSA